MNVTGLILLGAGYLLGNPPARENFFSGLQKMAGNGIDALNKMGGGEPNARPVESEPTE